MYNRRLRIKRVMNSYPDCLAYATLLRSEYAGSSGWVEVTHDYLINMSESATRKQPYATQQGIVVTRPMDLGEPDVLKVVTDLRVRGQYPKGKVNFILEGSNDGINFMVLNTMRGKAWKLFRLTIIAELGQADRISWVDIRYETRFTNKLR
jgi:hypothetical protein